MLITVLFIKVNTNLHKGIKSKSVSYGMPTYALYNNAMKDFSNETKGNTSPANFIEIPTSFYKDIRVEKIDRELYKSFKITCIQKDISISQGINLALASWLESRKNDNSDLELRA